jgi:cytochrome P450
LPRWWPNLGEIRARALVERVLRRAEAIQVATPASTHDVVSSLLTAEVAGSDRGLEQGIVTDNISMLLGAGSETVALVLTWTIMLLADAPEYRDKIEDELSAVTREGAFTASTLPKLVWTRAAIEEAMRLYPPAPMIGRMAVADDVIGGERVARGTAIIIAPWVVHRHRRLWRDPDTFRPEQFLPGARASIDRFAYLPFGAGPRVCIGAGFAMLEAVALLALLLGAFRFHRTDAAPVLPRQKLTLLPAAPIMMRAEKR